MPEVPVSSLDPRHQRLVENARVALERGNHDYVLEVTSQVLKMQPGCLPVRRLQRVAQLRQSRGKGGGFFGKAISGLSSAPFSFGRAEQALFPYRERGLARERRQAEARAVCAGCPVRVQCGKDAPGNYGIWAGEPEDSFVYVI